MQRHLLRAALILGALALSSCSTSSHVIVGQTRPPISPDAVRIYTQPPSKYEQIATIDASSAGSFAFTSQGNMDVAIARMKEEAAKVGANGVLLTGVHDQQSGSVGTGVGSSSYGPSSATGVGVGGSFGLYNKVTQGMAIYVPPDAVVPQETQPPPMPPPSAPPPVPPPPPQQ
ncbi:MAG TPA: hypothetical protein VMG33_12100 [Steroidobacteraceae bacterium]|nr:hypothetical protein [Steroidobacteraceae bacterium]